MSKKSEETRSAAQLVDELKLHAWLAKAELENPSLHKDVSALAQRRDQLRVQMALGKLEAREEFDRLEKNWVRVKTVLGDTAHDVGDDARELLEDIRRGYQRLRA